MVKMIEIFIICIYHIKRNKNLKLKKEWFNNAISLP